jgi:hypothetical protein
MPMSETTLYSALPEVHPTNLGLEAYSHGVGTGGPLVGLTGMLAGIESERVAFPIEKHPLAGVELINVTYTANAVNLYDVDVDSEWERVECAYFTPLSEFVFHTGLRARPLHESDALSFGSNLWDIWNSYERVHLEPTEESRIAHDSLGHLALGGSIVRRHARGRGRLRSATATMDATAAIRTLVPEFSEEALARLLGVTRQAWRDWMSGATLPRSKKRRRIYRLRRILELRRAVAPDQRLATWLESPVSRRELRTPADLLEAGRDDLVAALASSVSAPLGDEFEVEPVELGVPLDLEKAERALQEAREIATRIDDED